MIDQSGTRGTPRLELGQALLEFLQQENEFIGNRIFPIFPSPLKAANYSAITRESLAQVADTRRGPKGNYNRGSIGAKDKSFSCEENGFEMPLSDDDRALYATDFDAEWAATKASGMILLRNQEQRIANLLADTSVFTGSALYTNISSSAPWATAGSDILGAVRSAKEQIRKNCGMYPNALIMSATNKDRALANTSIVSRVTGAMVASDVAIKAKLAELFDIKNILVGNAIKNSAKEGQAFSGSDIWSSTYVILAVIAEDGKDLTQPGVGRTFLWTKDCPENVLVESYRDNPIRSDVFRARQHTDEQLIDPYFAHVLKVA